MIDGDPRRLPRMVKFLIDFMQYAAIGFALWLMMKYPPP